jgi:hypothetical protein
MKNRAEDKAFMLSLKPRSNTGACAMPVTATIALVFLASLFALMIWALVRG